MSSSRNNTSLPKASLFIILLSSCIFLFLVWLVLNGKTNSLDESAFAFSKKITTDTNTRWILAITFLGKHSFLIPANISLLIFLAIQKNRSLFLRLLLISLSSVTVMSLIKRLVHRIRPENGMIEGVTNFSFPSGHAFMSVALYGFLIWWSASEIKGQRLRIFLIIFLVLLILIVGCTRIYLRMHYASDVLAGFAGGTAWLLSCLYIIQKLENRPVNKMPG